MEILLNTDNFNRGISAPHLLEKKKKMDTDEKTVRKTLVKVWTIVLERYARPGVPMPNPEALKHELLRIGVDAGVEAVLENHWVVFDWMVRPEIHAKIEAGLNCLPLAEVIEKVRYAQEHPEILPQLRADIKHYVMHGF